MVKACLSGIPPVADFSHGILISLRAINFVIGFLNIAGNALLIYALKKTGQTRTNSIRFIVFMSISDCITGIIGLFLITLLLWGKFQDRCFLKEFVQTVTNLTCIFSVTMIGVIALDRYFHMKYLERYPSKMTNRRSYCIALFCLCCTALLVIGEILMLIFDRNRISILQFAILCAWFPFFVCIVVLYYKAYKSLQSRASSQVSQIMKNALQESRKFAKIARLIVISLGFLTTPMLVYVGLQYANHLSHVIDQHKMNVLFWFALLLHTANGFTSSIIFMSYNTSVKQLLGRIVTGNRNRTIVALKS